MQDGKRVGGVFCFQVSGLGVGSDSDNPNSY